MQFVKMEALGNDFVVFEGPLSPTPEAIRQICDRHHGVGADGLIVVTPLTANPTQIRMEYWNADGSQAEMCGNGLRCIALWGRLNIPSYFRDFTVLTQAGPRRVVVPASSNQINVEMGKINLKPNAMIENIHHYPEYAYPSYNVGNPHVVIVVDDVDNAPVDTLGPVVDDSVPGGANVEFVQIITPNWIKVRVWERGVGETLACGTGAVAAMAEAQRNHRADNPVKVSFPGGDVLVRATDESVWLTGPARVSYSGEWPQELGENIKYPHTLSFFRDPPSSTFPVPAGALIPTT